METLGKDGSTLTTVLKSFDSQAYIPSVSNDEGP